MLRAHLFLFLYQRVSISINYSQFVSAFSSISVRWPHDHFQWALTESGRERPLSVTDKAESSILKLDSWPKSPWPVFLACLVVSFVSTDAGGFASLVRVPSAASAHSS